MAFGSPKGICGIGPSPKLLSAILLSVGALVFLLVFSSRVLVSGPVGSAFNASFLGIDRYARYNSAPFNASGVDELLREGNSLGYGDQDARRDKKSPSGLTGPGALKNGDRDAADERNSSGSLGENSLRSVDRDANDERNSRSGNQDVSDGRGTSVSPELPNLAPVPESSVSIPVNASSPLGSWNNRTPIEIGKPRAAVPTSPTVTNTVLPASNSSTKIDQRRCNLFKGKWFYDSLGPLYSNGSCPVLTQTQNCQGNGRPDKEYENWRWKPGQCDLPRFDPKKFLQLMRGKSLAFIGDSVARNQMEALLCALWKAEVPVNRGNRKMHRWQFKRSSFELVRIWSSWLVHKAAEAFQFAPVGVNKLFLDLPDESFVEFLPKFDVIVISSGHWFAKQAVFIHNNKIVGGQLWWPDKTHKMEIDSDQAFKLSVETALNAIATHPNYTGLTILRTYSPDHYEGGAWNTGGSCTGKVRPRLENELVVNEHTEAMHMIQVDAFEKARKKLNNKSKMALLDITGVFNYRPDGHPGPYRNKDPNKITTRGPNGEPPPQDCLHWCMPGPVDTWNELMLEVIRREFEEPDELSDAGHASVF